MTSLNLERSKAKFLGAVLKIGEDNELKYSELAILCEAFIESLSNVPTLRERSVSASDIILIMSEINRH